MTILLYTLVFLWVLYVLSISGLVIVGFLMLRNLIRGIK